VRCGEYRAVRQHHLLPRRHVEPGAEPERVGLCRGGRLDLNWRGRGTSVRLSASPSPPKAIAHARTPPPSSRQHMDGMLIAGHSMRRRTHVSEEGLGGSRRCYRGTDECRGEGCAERGAARDHRVQRSVVVRGLGRQASGIRLGHHAEGGGCTSWRAAEAGGLTRRVGCNR